jgi:spore coat protein H
MVIYNGESGTGFIRSCGGGSRMHPRWSYRIKLNNYFQVEQLSQFSLSSQSLDPTMIHTTLVSRLYALRGIPIFRSKHVFLKINNRDKGLYLLIERINEDFFWARNIQPYEIYKAGLDSDFSFNSPRHPLFTYEKKLPEDDNYKHLFDFFKAIETSGIANIESSLGAYLDIDNYLQYHAISSITNNHDAFRNNYYLYRKTAVAPYRLVPWDFDRAFDPIYNVGLAGKNSLFNKISQNQNIRDQYIAEIKFLLDNSFREDILFPIIDSTAIYIAPAYNMDPFLGAGGYNLDFQVNLLKEMISDRIKYFIENIDDF